MSKHNLYLGGPSVQPAAYSVLGVGGEDRDPAFGTMAYGFHPEDSDGGLGGLAGREACYAIPDVGQEQS